MTPPDLVLLAGFNGDWKTYENELHRIFISEIARGSLQLRGLPVNARRMPETAGRWASFWHLIQEGLIEVDRLPDLRRCERIRWIRWVILECETHPDIDIWQNIRGTETNLLLWYREEYLVVLSRRRNVERGEEYWLLKTAYCTEKSGRIRQLRKERDASHGDAGILKD